MRCRELVLFSYDAICVSNTFLLRSTAVELFVGYFRMDGIVAKGAGAMEGNGFIAMLGGIQINTPEDTSDYFLPLTFDLRNSKGELQKSLMW